MSTRNSDLRAAIETAKQRIPLPQLLERYSLQVPSNGEGNMRSPFAKGRRQKSPSFSIFRRNDAWGWCDRTGGQEIKGDEIDFIEQFENISRAEAIRRYLDMAGVGEVAIERKESSPRDSKESAAARAADSPPDWAACVAKFTDDYAARLVELRGYSLEFVRWLRDQSLIGIRKDGIAFPVYRADGALVAVHIRSQTGRWFYHPSGAGCHPFIIGNAQDAKQTMVFESQWDAFAVMDAIDWHESAPEGWSIVITRGAGNGRFAAVARGAIYSWPQNDPEKDGKRAGEVWLEAVTAAASGEVFRVVTPPEFKDANDWARATKLDVWAAIDSAKQVAKPPSRFEMATGGRILPDEEPSKSASASPTFDPIATIEEMGLYRLLGSDSYFVQQNGNGFQEHSPADIKRELRIRGYRSRPDAEGGKLASEIDLILQAALKHHSVDVAVNIGGMKADVYDMNGARVLVRASPRLIEPKSGNYDTILEFLSGLLGNLQLDYLLSLAQMVPMNHCAPISRDTVSVSLSLGRLVAGRVAFSIT